MIEIDQEDFGTLCICAIRYCQGRQTYMPHLVQRICRGHLKELSDKDIGVMLQDCEFQRTTQLYGDPRIDMPGWLQWEEDVMREQKRRESDEQ